MSFLPYVSTIGRREGEMAQMRAYGGGGQAGGRGREQGAGGWAGQGVRASWQEGAGGEGTLRAK